MHRCRCCGVAPIPPIPPTLPTAAGATLPLPCVERIFDLFVFDASSHGLLVVFHCGLAILKMNYETLLRTNLEGPPAA